MQNKIILKNARYWAKDYAIYLLTIVFSISLIYSFNLLVFSEDIQRLSNGMNVLTGVIIFLSFAIVWVLGWLIHYMAKFMMKKRSREFGTYMLLGVPNKTIASLFAGEQALIGSVGFLLSLVIGSLLYQVLAMMVICFFGASYHLKLAFSWEAFGLTLLYTVCMYGSAILRLRSYLKNAEIHELLYLDREGEEEVRQERKGSLLAFFFYLFLGICGCFVFVYSVYLEGEVPYSGDYSGWYFLGSMAVILLCIYKIYTHMTYFLTRTVLSKGDFKYGKDRLFLLRGLTAKLNTIGKTLGILALLLTITLTAMQMGVLFEKFFQAQADNIISFDVAMSGNKEKIEEQQLEEKLEQRLQKQYGITFGHSYPIYQNPDDTLYTYTGLDGYLEFTPVMAYGDFQLLWKALGYEELSLGKQEYLLLTSEKIQERSRREEVPALEIQGETYQLKELSSRPFSTGSGLHGTGFLVVLPDEAAETFPVYHTCYVFETKKEIPANEGMELSQWLSENGAYDVSGDYRKNAVDEFMVASDTRASQNSVFVTFAFSLFYVGLIFACCAAAILAVQQLSDGVSYKHRYEILSYLGADEGKMQGLVLKQMIFYFFIPVAIPIPVSIFLASQINQVLLADLITVKAFCMAIAISIGLFFLVYFIYFLATYLGYRKRVLE